MRVRTHGLASGTWSTYWFEKNLQGDIVAVYDDEGEKLITYTYDAWAILASVICIQALTILRLPTILSYSEDIITTQILDSIIWIQGIMTLRFVGL